MDKVKVLERMLQDAQIRQLPVNGRSMEENGKNMLEIGRIVGLLMAEGVEVDPNLIRSKELADWVDEEIVPEQTEDVILGIYYSRLATEYSLESVQTLAWLADMMKEPHKVRLWVTLLQRKPRDREAALAAETLLAPLIEGIAWGEFREELGAICKEGKVAADGPVALELERLVALPDFRKGHRLTALAVIPGLGAERRKKVLAETDNILKDSYDWGRKIIQAVWRAADLEPEIRVLIADKLCNHIESYDLFLRSDMPGLRERPDMVANAMGRGHGPDGLSGALRDHPNRTLFDAACLFIRKSTESDTDTLWDIWPAKFKDAMEIASGRGVLPSKLGVAALMQSGKQEWRELGIALALKVAQARDVQEPVVIKEGTGKRTR